MLKTFRQVSSVHTAKQTANLGFKIVLFLSRKWILDALYWLVSVIVPKNNMNVNRTQASKVYSLMLEFENNFVTMLSMDWLTNSWNNLNLTLMNLTEWDKLRGVWVSTGPWKRNRHPTYTVSTHSGINHIEKTHFLSHTHTDLRH